MNDFLKRENNIMLNIMNKVIQLAGGIFVLSVLAAATSGAVILMIEWWKLI